MYPFDAAARERLGLSRDALEAIVADVLAAVAPDHTAANSPLPLRRTA
jgi:hypothetical protein